MSFYFSHSVVAQKSSCSQDFSQITLDCLQENSSKFNQQPISLKKLKKSPIIFYQTQTGEYGKIKVLSHRNDLKMSCDVFFDLVPLGPKSPTSSLGRLKPKSSLSIASNKNYWLRDLVYLNSQSSEFIALEKLSKGEANGLSKGNQSSSQNGPSSEEQQKRAVGECYLVTSAGTSFFLYKNSNQSDFIQVEESPILLYGSLGLVFVAIFILVREFVEDQDKYKNQEALDDRSSQESKNLIPFLKFTKPFYKRYFLPIVQSSKNKKNIKSKYRQKIANAGLSKDLTSEEFVSLKFFMILGSPFLFLFFRYFFEADWPISLTPVMGALGFYYPDLWINGLIKKRSDEIIQGMPFIIDMLALSVEAGLDFMAAIQRIIEKAPPGPLVDEFETLIRETKIGASRSEGLRQLSWRINVIEINSFCATLIAADSVGASIGPLLKQLSNDIRVKRTSRAEKLGATAATKILFPMILFILPAVIIAIFVPMILRMMAGNT